MNRNVAIALGLAVLAACSKTSPASGEHAGHDQGATPAAPATPATRAAGAADPHAGHTGSASVGSETPSTTPPGYADVGLDPAQASAMGLTTAPVEHRDFRRTIRTVGVVTVDETRTAHVHARVRGWIEGFHVQYVGQKVSKGQPLVSVYSQEVYAAELELASLLRSSVKSPELLDAAQKRLSLWEVPKSTVEAVIASGEPQRTFPISAPRSGVVVAKQAFDGQFIDPSLELYTISDLSKVWVFADIYESDVADVRVGAEAKLTIEGVAEPVTAKVAFLAPTIDERTRTRKARFDLANKSVLAMPGAFVTVEMDVGMGHGLAVPESAVIRTGERAIVFVVHGGVHAVPREVKLGGRVGDAYRVLAGLEADEEVATGAQFLLDSESRLRATSAAGGGHAGHGGH
ncbi:MAG: efflux RND transporter periplasmic adaptor subunit [Myxococcales bacterium]|nr:efflux RND transporter periplasmic adaptor subunit [Myxococcales bacterium]